jgi:hypothetical protein
MLSLFVIPGLARNPVFMKRGPVARQIEQGKNSSKRGFLFNIEVCGLSKKAIGSMGQDMKCELLHAPLNN